jgi:cob(I)alamin adenosyltransferase
MKKSKIYTKTGDKGTTSLIGGTRVAKNHIRLNAYGSIDELNSFLGVLRAQLADDEDKKHILKIQHELFNVGGALASEEKKYADSCLVDSSITWLERQIDIIDQDLPLLKSFVIPSGYFPAAICHVCRAVCRRSERAIYDLLEKEYVPNRILIFMNRLSDYLFVLSRKIAVVYDKEEFFSNSNCEYEKLV